MLGLRAVADFAMERRMSPELFLIDDFSVAAFTCLVSCMSDRAGGEFSDRVSAIMPVLAEGLRYHRRAQYDERHHRDEHHNGKPDQVLYVLEQSLTFGAGLGARYTLRGKSAMIFDTGNPVGER
jgi:hypothetical protein